MNKLTILDRIAKNAMKKALKSYMPLEEDWKALGKTIDDFYEEEVESEFRNLERGLKLLPKLDALLDKYGVQQKKPEKLSNNYFWITLRPGTEHQHRFTEFKHLILTKYLTRNCFSSYRYAWEQKGETPNDMGNGYHIHILALCPNYLMKTQLIKDTKSTFKKFCNGDVPDAFVQIEYIRTKEHFFNIRAYIMGIKSDTWKDPACAMDIPWREKLNLDSLYGTLDLENP